MRKFGRLDLTLSNGKQVNISLGVSERENDFIEWAQMPATRKLVAAYGTADTKATRHESVMLFEIEDSGRIKETATGILILKGDPSTGGLAPSQIRRI